MFIIHALLKEEIKFLKLLDGYWRIHWNSIQVLLELRRIKNGPDPLTGDTKTIDF